MGRVFHRLMWLSKFLQTDTEELCVFNSSKMVTLVIFAVTIGFLVQFCDDEKGFAPNEDRELYLPM